MKMKEFGPPGGGARPWRPPLGSANGISYKRDFVFNLSQICLRRILLRRYGAGTSDGSEICEGFTSFLSEFYNGGLCENIY